VKIVKIQTVLRKKKETPGTVVYAVANPTSVAVGQVYVRKEHMAGMKVDGAWPEEITVSIEAGDTTGDQ
jgi:hypothetical protein